ncbi:PLP-dependent aminotransferase family protein [Vibrio ostreicida]|uniref:PLP-dependent aminotransferase family protein n=1 Tax=Vibrio ostreicida TaxID=526588 RepID=A0ABT8BZ94_9VIBR|nr:PLP-dependent aminotransferase family protein [Vibrio ostreicida]MDN3612480.1 PLP-dependent aminotransferase family protein [Vibrio ostreicida]NPD10187.1 PLP-dependent aminotransferase family protein [Vibrio ostreicida]
MGTDKSSLNKFAQVEQYIVEAISQGVFQSDDKLPSIRQLGRDLNVSKNTVIRAYQELEAADIIYAVPKSGYRVLPPQPLSNEHHSPHSVDLLSLSKQILSYPQSKERLPTGSAHPNIDAPAIKSLYAEIGRQSRAQSHMPSHYQLPPGNALLIKQLAKMSRELGVKTHSQAIAVTQGAQQAISLALRALTRPGDIVAVESPCYFGNLLLMESLGLKVVEVASCVRRGMDPQALKHAIEEWPIRVILITPNFANPTGARIPLERRIELLSVSRDIPIIEDDVFGALAFDDGLLPLKTLDNQDRVIYVNSLSKMLDSRLRIGWLLSGKYHSVIEKYLLCENMGSSNLIQSAVSEFLATGKYRQHISKMKRMYQHNIRRFCLLLTQALDQYAELRCQHHLSQPQGSFLVWLTLPQHLDSFALYQACRRRRISIFPGTVFSTSGQFRQCIRLSCAHFEETTEWHTGIELLAELIHQQLKKRLESPCKTG